MPSSDAGKSNKVLVIGGSGFIGYHLIEELKRSGYQATVGSRSIKSLQSEKNAYFDLKAMSDDQLRAIIQDFDYIIFSGGVDDRTKPDEDASSFFYNGNVAPCVRLAVLCRDLPVKKIIMLGSYFSHFDRVRPQWKMSDRHPYVKSRKLQHEETVAASEGKTQIVTLDLPYIFGSSPGKVPLWKPLVDYIRSSSLIFYTEGGTNIVAVEQVARATVGAIEHAAHDESWIVGDRNVSWKELISLFATAIGKPRTVVTIPTPVVRICATIYWALSRLLGWRSGLHPYHFVTTQTANTFLDAQLSMDRLRYARADMQESIAQTVRACEG
jgi:nucleoside-diphosphate-sugar epimerase